MRIVFPFILNGFVGMFLCPNVSCIMKSLQLFIMGVDSSCSILVLPTLRFGFRYICIWNLSYLAWDLPLKMAAIIQICMIAAFTMKSGIFAHPFDILDCCLIYIICAGSSLRRLQL